MNNNIYNVLAFFVLCLLPISLQSAIGALEDLQHSLNAFTSVVKKNPLFVENMRVPPIGEIPRDLFEVGAIGFRFHADKLTGGLRKLYEYAVTELVKIISKDPISGGAGPFFGALDFVRKSSGLPLQPFLWDVYENMRLEDPTPYNNIYRAGIICGLLFYSESSLLSASELHEGGWSTMQVTYDAGKSKEFMDGFLKKARELGWREKPTS